MKRLISILLLICFCAALFGCYEHPAEQGEASASPAASSEQPTSATDGAPAATEASPYDTQTAENFDYALYAPDDYCIDYRSFVGNMGGGSPVVETEDSIYVLSKGFLYFSDKEYKDFMPLCARPNCSHDSADCDAYLGASAIQYRNGYIYYVSDCGWGDFDANRGQLHSPSVCRMRRDGSQHEELLKVPIPGSDNTAFLPESDWWECIASNKYFMLRFNRTAYDEDYNPIHDLHMLSVDMDTLAVTELLTDPELPDNAGACFLMLEGRDNYIYGQMYYEAFELGKNKIVEIDLVTGALRELCTFRPVLRYTELVSSLRGDGLYFIDFDMAKDVETLYCVNIKTGELTEKHSDAVTTSDWKIFDSYDGYYYNSSHVKRAPEEQGFYICDPAFNVVEFMPFDELPAEYIDYYEGFIADAKEQYPDLENADQRYYPFLSYITRDVLFFVAPSIGVNTYYVTLEDENGEPILDENGEPVREKHDSLTIVYSPYGGLPGWYLDKSEIGSGNMQWRKWVP